MTDSLIDCNRRKMVGGPVEARPTATESDGVTDELSRLENVLPVL